MIIASAISHFIIGFMVSFLGTLPPGTINIEALRLGMQHSLSLAIRFILATLVAEFIYTFIAIHFSAYLMSFPKLEYYISILTVPVFLILGVSYFFIKPPDQTIMESSPKEKSVFFKGIILGFINPFQIPFWLTWASYFLTLGWIKQDSLLLSLMTLGALTGSFTMLFLFARFGSATYMKKLNVRSVLINNFLGILLIMLALYSALTNFILQ